MSSKNSFSDLSRSLLNNNDQTLHNLPKGGFERGIYTAIVRDNKDKSGQNRIKAEIISLDENGRVQPGKDKNIPTDKLPLSIPLLPQMFHVLPQVGESVMIFVENPSDITSLRYYIGPIITHPDKLSYQSFQDSFSIFNSKTYRSLESMHENIDESKRNNLGFPTKSDVAVQGKNDADIIFRFKEVLIRAGKFQGESLTLNDLTPCDIQLKQVTSVETLTGIKSIDQKQQSSFKPFSQQNIRATNINIYSQEGKFRSPSIEDYYNVKNTRLSDFGELAQSLHPVGFGDEIAKVIKLLLNFVVNHIHTPQSPPLVDNNYNELLPYINGNKLQDLFSSTFRIN
jgi:hypothetical protein